MWLRLSLFITLLTVMLRGARASKPRSSNTTQGNSRLCLEMGRHNPRACSWEKRAVWDSALGWDWRDEDLLSPGFDVHKAIYSPFCSFPVSPLSTLPACTNSYGEGQVCWRSASLLCWRSASLVSSAQRGPHSQTDLITTSLKSSCLSN